MPEVHNAVSVSIVVPFHNEEPNVIEMYGRLHGVMESLGRNHQFVFVDDGSTDLRPTPAVPISGIFRGEAHHDTPSPSNELLCTLVRTHTGPAASAVSALRPGGHGAGASNSRRGHQSCGSYE